MSNKTSDKNVAKVTKSDIDILNALIYVYEARLPNYNELMDSEVKALKNILAEREQDKKRIQELEKEKIELKEYNKIVSDRIVEYKKNSIPKQVITDLIKKETIDISGFKCIAVEDLQELLEGEKNEF